MVWAVIFNYDLVKHLQISFVKIEENLFFRKWVWSGKNEYWWLWLLWSTIHLLRHRGDFFVTFLFSTTQRCLFLYNFHTEVLFFCPNIFVTFCDAEILMSKYCVAFNLLRHRGAFFLLKYFVTFCDQIFL